MSIRLNTYQNEMIVVQVMVDTVIVSFAIGTFIASIFSVNVINGLEEVNLLAFWSTFVILQFIVVLALLAIEKSLRSSGIVIGQPIETKGSVA